VRFKQPGSLAAGGTSGLLSIRHQYMHLSVEYLTDGSREVVMNIVCEIDKQRHVIIEHSTPPVCGSAVRLQPANATANPLA